MWAIYICPRCNASGNAAPIRAIKGAKTGLKYPTGIFLDTEHLRNSLSPRSLGTIQLNGISKSG